MKKKLHSHFLPQFLRRLWERFFCEHGWHLWREVPSDENYHHHLNCDACFEILFIDDEKQKNWDNWPNIMLAQLRAWKEEENGNDIH